ncbi:MAG: LysM peptidoglycan-binding domain-containing protein, partial [Clostridia bacterium]
MKEFIYRVEENEDIETIAKKFLLNKDEVLQSNKIEKEKVQEGARLWLKLPEGSKYIVKPFDTLNSISKKFLVDVEDIKENNKIENVFVG